MKLRRTFFRQLFYGRKISGVLLINCFLFVVHFGMAQTWSYDFGSGIGVHASDTSTVFLPQPVSGSDFVRVGTGGGAMVLENPGTGKNGSKTVLRIIASSSSSYNKASIFDYASGTSFYISFSILLGDSAGGNSAGSGTLTFIQGNGNNFSNASNYSSNETFTGIRWSFGSGGTLDIKYLNGSSWTTLSGVSLMQGNVYTFEVFGNNTSSLIAYNYNGMTETLAAFTQDIWINRHKAGNDLGKSNLPDGNPLDSWMFLFGSSTSNLANSYIDDVIYSNFIDTVYIGKLNYYAAFSGYLDIPTSWTTNNDGSGTEYPIGFNQPYVHYYIRNSSSPQLSNDWIVTGTASKVLLGDENNNVSFSTGAFNLDLSSLEINTNAVLLISPGHYLTIHDELVMDDAECLIMQSSVGNDAAGSFICEGVVSGTGTVKAERYIDPYTTVSNGWHLLASPVSCQAVFDDATDLYYFSETSNTWINSNGGSFGDTCFVPARAYLIAYNSGIKKDFCGTPNNSDIILNSTSWPVISFTPGQGEGWNLVGNPFASAIDWDELSRTNIDGAVYIWNGAQYNSWNGSVGNIVDGIIPAMQGFFIKANAANPELIIEKGDRLHATQAFYKTITTNLLELKIEGNGLSDHTYIHFRNAATAGFDNQYDAYKLYGAPEAPQLYSMTGGEILSINSLPGLFANTSIQLGYEVGVNGIYTLSAAGMMNFTIPVKFILEDTKENCQHEMSLNPQYAFQASVNDDPGRFILHISIVDGLDENLKKQAVIFAFERKIVIQNIEAHGSISVMDAHGKELFHRECDQNSLLEFDMHSFSKGYYLVRLLTARRSITKKVLIL